MWIIQVILISYVSIRRLGVFKFLRKIALIPLLLSQITYAGDSLILSGAESASGSSYYYLGYLTPLGESQIGSGYVQRLWIDHLAYEYTSGPNLVKAKAPGASYAIGYQGHTDIGSGGVFIGLDGRKTDFTPDDVTNKARGSQFSPVVSLEASRKMQPLVVFSNFSYLTETRAYWGRIRLLSDTVIKWGVEASVQGDPSYHTRKLGLYAGDVSIGQDIKIGAKVGKTYTGDSNGAYLGVELVKVVK